MAALVLLASCSNFKVLHTVAEMKGNPELAIEISFGEDTLRNLNPPDGGTLTQLTLGPWSHGTDSTTCPALGGDAVATLNGRVIQNEERGGLAAANVCGVPSWRFDSADTVQPTMEIKIKDSSGELVATFINVTSRRTLSVAAPDGGVIHAGGPMLINLSPVTDFFPSTDDPTNLGGTLDLSLIDATGSIQYTRPHILGSVGTVASVPAGTTSISAYEIGTTGTTRCDVGHCDLPFVAITPTVAVTVVP
jgi:hypothetical protein